MVPPLYLSVDVDQAWLESERQVLFQTLTQIRLALRLLQVAEGALLRAVFSTGRDFPGPVQVQLQIGRLAVALVGVLRPHPSGDRGDQAGDLRWRERNC